MKKNLYAVLAVFSGAFTLGAFPLEWNLNNRTNVPYEVEINRTKLEKLAGVSKNCGFDVTATTPAGKEKLEVTLLKGSSNDTVSLRFTVPEGTTALDCQVASDAAVSEAGKLNFFNGALADVSAWKSTNGGKIKAADGKICFKATRFGETIFSCTVDVPSEFAGTAAKFDFDFKSTSPEVWASTINVE